MEDDCIELHRIVLNIYKEFQTICTKHKLKYFAISGTTLGATLWNGIIPWDDDMDIAMPADDFIKFATLSKTELPSFLTFSEYIWFGGKLHDKRTTFTNINYIHDPARYNGVFIDIVPLISLPNNKNHRDLFVKNLKEFQKFGLLYDRYQDAEFEKSKLEEWRNTILFSNKFGTTNYVMDFSDPRYILSAKGFTKPIIMDFEDTTIPVSSNYKEDLTIQYGKYKKYPDKKTRKSIHNQQSILDLQRPYKELIKEFNQLPDWVKTMFIKKNQNEGSYLKSLYYNQDLLAKSNEELSQTKAKLEETTNILNTLKQGKTHKSHSFLPFTKKKKSI